MSKNLLGHRIRVFQHIVIPKPHDAHAQFIESPRPFTVGFRLGFIPVLAAVEFNGQSARRAIEIQDISADAMLPAKSVAG
jgi:hypothetical protein